MVTNYHAFPGDILTAALTLGGFKSSGTYAFFLFFEMALTLTLLQVALSMHKEARFNTKCYGPNQYIKGPLTQMECIKSSPITI